MDIRNNDKNEKDWLCSFVYWIPQTVIIHFLNFFVLFKNGNKTCRDLRNITISAGWLLPKTAYKSNRGSLQPWPKEPETHSANFYGRY